VSPPWSTELDMNQPMPGSGAQRFVVYRCLACKVLTAPHFDCSQSTPELRQYVWTHDGRRGMRLDGALATRSSAPEASRFGVLAAPTRSARGG
jgi:hypothetical protein